MVCEFCNLSHENIGQLCTNCHACFNLCARIEQQCRWANNHENIEGPKPVNRHDKFSVLGIQDLFVNWVESSGYFDKTHDSAKSIFENLVEFSNEELKKVDQNSEHYKILDDGTANKLDNESLYVNNKGFYCLIKDRKRINFKKVAVIRGQDVNKD